MDYEKKYKMVLNRAREIHRNEVEKRFDMEWLFPELKESEDEKIRKALIRFHKSTIDVDGIKGEEIIAWLEKQGSSSVKWQKNTSDNKPAINHSVLIKTTHGVAEGYFVGSLWFQFRWSSNIKDSDVLAWMELSDLDEQNEQKPTSDIKYEVKNGDSLSVDGKPFDYEHATITQKDFACDAEEASYTAEVATGDGSIKTVVSKKVSLPNPQSKEWSEEDEVINNELIKYFESLLDCLATEERHNENRKWLKWLKSIKNKI